MKTPEELAEEYMNQDKVACAAINHDAEDLVEAAFLAGYQAAKDHVVDVNKMINGDTSDGYHTFNELYEHRTLLFLMALKAGAFKGQVVCEDHFPCWDVITCYICYSPGEYAQISYHVPIKYRPYYEYLSRCTKEQQEENFDGHTAKIVADRMKRVLKI